jgi:hypothetical protein
VQGARNYPFPRIPTDLDVDLPRGTGDQAYLAALTGALDVALAAGEYEIAFFLAGADPLGGRSAGFAGTDQGGPTAPPRAGARHPRRRGHPGMRGPGRRVAPDVEDLVDIHTATAREVAARTRQPVA